MSPDPNKAYRRTEKMPFRTLGEQTVVVNARSRRGRQDVLLLCLAALHALPACGGFRGEVIGGVPEQPAQDATTSAGGGANEHPSGADVKFTDNDAIVSDVPVIPWDASVDQMSTGVLDAGKAPDSEGVKPGGVIVEATWSSPWTSGGDPSIAVGPNHVMQYNNNNKFVIWSKSGSLLADGNGAPGKLFTNALADGHILFDETSQRWIAVILANSPYGYGIAVSDSADPTAPWSEVHNDLNVKGSGPDGMHTGVTADAVLIYSPSGSVIFNKASLLDKNSATLVQTIHDVYFAPEGAVPTSRPGDPYWTDTTGWGFSFRSTGKGAWIRKVSGVLGTPTFQDYNVPFGTATGLVWHTGVGQRNDKMVMAGAVGNGGDDKRDVNNSVQWAVVDLSSGTPALLQSGAISAPLGGRLSWATAAIDGEGNIGITYLQTTGPADSPTTSIYATGRAASDPRDTLRPPVLVASRAAGWISVDYVNAVVDIDASGKAKSRTFWAISTLESREVTSVAWRVQLTRFSLQ